MAHFYALFRRKQQISNRFLRMDDMTEDELFQCTRFTRPAEVELLELVRDDLERPTQADITPFLLAALQFFSSGSFQWMVGCSCGLSQPAVKIVASQN